jgi:hypothetical protein
VPEYVWFNPDDPKELRGFRLAGVEYEEIAPDEHGRLWSKVLGHYLGVHEGWLRLYDPDGNLVPTDGEAREAAEQLVQQERAAREAAEAEVAWLREELARLKAER